MSLKKDSVGVALGVMSKLGLVAPVDEEPPVMTVVPKSSQPATPEALAKLRADIGLDEPSSAYHVFEGILQTLEDAIPDVALRYKKALQLAERQAVTAELIVHEFGTFRDHIEQQTNVMTATLEDLTRKKIAPQQAQRTNVEAALRLSRQEVAKLEAELDVIAKSIKAEEDSLAAISTNFTAAAGTLTAELSEKERTFTENLNLKKK
jgi:hypothetical protein